MRMTGQAALVLFAVTATAAGAQARFDAEAVRLNNRGVAQMGQQFTERAADVVCRGLQEGPQAGAGGDQRGHCAAGPAKAGRGQEGARSRPSRWSRTTRRRGTTWALPSTRATSWSRRSTSFQQAVKIDPRDADSYLFRGRLLPGDEGVRQGHRDFPESAGDRPAARFGGVSAGARLAALRPQRTEAKEHFKRFQHLTSTKIGAPIGLSYGEQGHYSTVTPVEEPEAGKKRHDSGEAGGAANGFPGPKIRTGARRTAPAFTTTGGACMMDVTGSGQHGPGADAIGRAGHSRAAQQGRRQL